MKKNLHSLEKQLQQINQEDETKQKLSMIGNDKRLRNLTIAINQSLEKRHEMAAKNRLQQEDMRREITNISHDFRTPLTSIHGFIELIMEKNISEADKVKYLKIVLDKINVLSTITESFYELSLYELKDEKINLEQVNVYDIIVETILPFHHDFEQKGIQFHLEMADEHVNAYVDRFFMQRILINLIQNGLRYAKSKFELVIEKEAETMKLIANNDHEGMENIYIPSLFKRTYTFSNSRSNKHLGLGLYIVKELVEKQHGEIYANKNEDMFSICIVFPRQ